MPIASSIKQKYMMVKCPDDQKASGLTVNNGTQIHHRERLV